MPRSAAARIAVIGRQCGRLYFSSKQTIWESAVAIDRMANSRAFSETDKSFAAEAVLRGFFGSDEVNVSVTFPAVFGVTRTYRSFSAITEEVDNARVWGGIHFRSADKDGSAVGRRIGEMALRDFPRAVESLAEVR